MAEAAAQYKKKDGKVNISADGRRVSWKSNGGDLSVDIEIAEVTNLQQTPATSAKASTKIVVQRPDQTENHTFTFTSATAREDQQSITALLRKCIEESKVKEANAPFASAAPAAATPAPAPAQNNGGASASMTIAQTLVNAPKDDDQYNDAKLLGDIALQRSLLNSNPALRQRFDQALRDKPESISIIQFSNQFWATRVHLLRSHTVENTQATGTYNVLSVVKPFMDKDGKEKLNMSKEQIVLIFSQYPLIRKVYNENVPPLTEPDFWSRFFHSRLIRKLKGEKITDIDPVDPKLDKYLNFSESANDGPHFLVDSVPRFLDVEGNEQNHSQRLGNRPDEKMRPSTNEKEPILRVLNRMSEKLMAQVPPSDGASRHGPAGMDEETYNQLRLRDLQRASDDNRVVLKLQDQDIFFSAGQGLQTSSSAAAYTKRTPAQVLSNMQKELRSLSGGQAQDGGIDLHVVAGVDDESSSDEEPDTKQKPKVGNRSSRAGATSQILKAIRQRQRHGDDYLASQAAVSSEQARQLSIPEHVLDNLAVTHNTTVEFLHYFWAVYYSGDAERANEVAKLVETLDKSLDRIKAIADTTEAERMSRVQRRVQENDEYTARTGRKRKFDANSIKGGSSAVYGLVEPLIRAINTARQQYQTALHEQLAQAQNAGAS